MKTFRITIRTKMKTIAFLIFYSGVLITLDNRVLASDSRERNWKAKGVEEVPPPRLSFPLLTLPSFSLPGLNFPYLQAFSQPNRMSPPERVRETKTEYVEVTRRQTVHPVCYTAYESRAPCLPYAQSDFQEDDYDGGDPDAIHQTRDGFHLNEVRKSAQTTSASEVTSGDSTRIGKYLEMKLRRDGAIETSTKIEGSEFFPTLNRFPAQQLPAEYHTKTVLITKLEKYTDRRVTATLLAVNCLPVDRSIPMCQSYPNPIREAPDRRSHDFAHFQAGGYNPTQTGYVSSKPDVTNYTDNVDLQLDTNENKAKSEVGVNVFEPADVNHKGTLLGEE